MLWQLNYDMMPGGGMGLGERERHNMIVKKNKKKTVNCETRKEVKSLGLTLNDRRRVGGLSI